MYLKVTLNPDGLCQADRQFCHWHKAMTIWPAYQHFEEKEKGSIEVGKLADLVILSADPTAVDPGTLDTLKVVETIKEGRTIYKAPK